MLILYPAECFRWGRQITVIVTGDADLLDAGLTPPAMPPRAVLDSLGRP